MEEYQVIIVGSGPAGAACAKALKDENIQALVIEKEELPRHKICSGILFGQTQVLLKKYFGTLPSEEVYCEPKIIKASNIQEWNREKSFLTYVWEISKNGQSFPQDYHNIWRKKFDYWLLQEARTEYRDNCRFRNFSMHNNKIKMEVSQKDRGNKDLYCSYLVGADGANSRVRMALDPTGTKQGKEVVIYQAYYRFSDMGSLEDAHWYVFFESQIGDMLSCIHRKDELLTLCIGGFTGRYLKENMEKFKIFLAEKFQVVFGDMERDERCVLRLRTPFLGKDRVIITGEAAGMMYLNGEGISAALDSGWQAGKAIAHGIKEGGDVLDIYRKETEGIIRHVQLCLKRLHFFA